MKKIFLACTVEENGKYYSFVETIKTGENLVCHMQRRKGLTTFHLCETRSQADKIVIAWNNQYKENGNYMFSDPLF